jgi:Soluble lytic murein transglycosylase and related regulatory proteins (some contain LysM/invasin domains)
MEKRPKKTHTHTLRWAASCLRLALIVILLLPGLVATGYMPRHYQIIEFTPPAEAQTIERPRSRDLVKIFSIIEANRPDIMEREAWELAKVISTESSKYRLDPILILAVIDVESKFQFGAISPAGARGIMQIMPATGKFLVKSVRELGREIKADQFTPEHLDNPVVNIKLGTYYLHDLRKSFRNLNEALTAYNLGPTELRIRMENQIGYTDDYANAVLAAHQRFKKIKPATF